MITVARARAENENESDSVCLNIDVIKLIVMQSAFRWKGKKYLYKKINIFLKRRRGINKLGIGAQSLISLQFQFEIGWIWVHTSKLKPAQENNFYTFI